ncbi:hypothetical protein BDW74DRAFT_155710 [Aspergillus multicolor]|uniref:uncharacterized protein n=1 Tax=Aspergillus multicolor TaxID=41759 RepID=UPI003CCD488C
MDLSGEKIGCGPAAVHDIIRPFHCLRWRNSVVDSPRTAQFVIIINEHPPCLYLRFSSLGILCTECIALISILLGFAAQG